MVSNKELQEITKIREKYGCGLNFAKKALESGDVEKFVIDNLDKSRILVNIKDNIEVEQIFIDYYAYYSENKEDPVLEIISSYWEA